MSDTKPNKRNYFGGDMPYLTDMPNVIRDYFRHDKLNWGYNPKDIKISITETGTGCIETLCEDGIPDPIETGSVVIGSFDESSMEATLEKAIEECAGINTKIRIIQYPDPSHYIVLRKD
jgi:hypothetical protein